MASLIRKNSIISETSQKYAAIHYPSPGTSQKIYLLHL